MKLQITNIVFVLLTSSTQGKKNGSSGGSNSTAPSSTTGQSTSLDQSAAVPSSSAAQIATGIPSSTGQGAQVQGIAEAKKDTEAEGLAQLIPDIQETAKLTQKIVQEFNEKQASSSKMAEGVGRESSLSATCLSSEEKYLARMKPLQFGERFSQILFLFG